MTIHNKAISCLHVQSCTTCVCNITSVDDDDHIAADIHELSMEERIVTIRNGPIEAMQALVIIQSDVEVESEWVILRVQI
jgi:hypothetical protein